MTLQEAKTNWILTTNIYGPHSPEARGWSKEFKRLARNAKARIGRAKFDQYRNPFDIGGLTP